ncbi:MAG: insulinase family protein [Betaproteobacteria bacterium]|nr:insulinase family protein [Betaproteobacteria bacterium]
MPLNTWAQRAATLFFGCVVGMSLAAGAKAQTPDSPSLAKAQRVRSVEGITEYLLPNGLRVLLAPDASKPTTTVNITYLVGSRHENYGETGMAHLLEHMVFKGTPSQGNIMTALGKRGMDFNGTTYTDRTNYFETFPASESNLRWVLQMEADRMVNSYIARADLDKEFSVVRNEMEAGENRPQHVLMQKILASSFDWHNYGKDTIGARSDVENVKIENLQNFYRKYYQPDNAVLVIAGAFDAALALSMVEQAFGPVPRPARVLEPTYTREAPRDGARELTVSRVADSYWLAALYLISAGAHPDTAALVALGEILASPPAGRLHTELVERKKASQSYAWTLDFAEPGCIIFWLELDKSQSMAQARQAMLEQIEGVGRKPITAAELSRAKATLLSDIDNTINNAQNLAIALSEAIAKGDWRLFFLQRDRIEALTVADVQRVAQHYLQSSNRTLGQFVPVAKVQRAVIPPTPVLADMLADYQGNLRTTLPGGTRLVLISKKTRGQTVSGQIVLELGDEKSLSGRASALEIAASLLPRGAGRRSRSDISSMLDTLKTKLAVSQEGQNLVLQFDTVRASLPALMPLLRDILRAPTFSPAEFEQARSQALTFANSQRSDPDALASNALARGLNNFGRKDIRYARSFDESVADLQALRLPQVKSAYAELAGAASAHFALAGDFDPAWAQTAASTLFAGWSSKQAFDRMHKTVSEPKPSTVLLQTPDKANAIYLAGLPLKARDTMPDYAALLLANEILGGGTQSRLLERLRQQEGISYGAGSQLRVSAFEPSGQLTLWAIFAPENRTKVEQAVSQELTRLAASGITEAELQDAKNSLDQQRLTTWSQDSALAQLQLDNGRTGRTMAFHDTLYRQIAASSVQDVNAAIARWITPAQLLHVYAGDFAGAKNKAAIGTRP